MERDASLGTQTPTRVLPCGKYVGTICYVPHKGKKTKHQASCLLGQVVSLKGSKILTPHQTSTSPTSFTTTLSPPTPPSRQPPPPQARNTSP